MNQQFINDQIEVQKDLHSEIIRQRELISSLYSKNRQLQAELDADKWIRVEDRLPEMYQRVLIKADSSCVAGREPKPVNNEDLDIGCDWVWAVVNDSYYDSHMVTHWRPLPEPPKELTK